jgi:hypothetical protein
LFDTFFLSLELGDELSTTVIGFSPSRKSSHTVEEIVDFLLDKGSEYLDTPKKDIELDEVFFFICKFLFFFLSP